MKMNYYNDIIQENKYYMKEVNCKEYHCFPAEFVSEGQLVNNKSNISEPFNDYFSQIELTTSQNVPSTRTTRTKYLHNPILHVY